MRCAHGGRFMRGVTCWWSCCAGTSATRCASRCPAAAWRSGPGCLRALNVERWAKASLARGARFFTGRQYMPSGRAIPFVRLGFGHLDERELAEAVRRMAAAR